MKYRYNPSCGCARCRAHGFMGPTVLITVGVLFLLDQMTHAYWLNVGKTWPALLIIIGLIMFLQHNAPATGHVPREYMVAPPPMQPQRQWQPPVPPVPPQPWQQPVQPPTAAPQQPSGETESGEVHNG